MQQEACVGKEDGTKPLEKQHGVSVPVVTGKTTVSPSELKSKSLQEHAEPKGPLKQYGSPERGRRPTLGGCHSRWQQSLRKGGGMLSPWCWVGRAAPLCHVLDVSLAL